MDLGLREVYTSLKYQNNEKGVKMSGRIKVRVIEVDIHAIPCWILIFLTKKRIHCILGGFWRKISDKMTAVWQETAYSQRSAETKDRMSQNSRDHAQ